jgi:hypothetical protein
MKICQQKGLTGHKTPVVRPFSAISEQKSVEQTVAGYDPQVIAWQWPFLATIVYSNAVGRA